MARRRRRFIWLAGIGAALVVLVGWAGLWMADDREADCGAYGIKRAGAICRALSDNMQFEWQGHAIIAPGYKVTFETVRRVYCQQKVNADDLRFLEQLLDSSDWRTQNGADFLIRLITGHDRYGAPEDISSVFNPGNPAYLLKEGCGG
jgi:hypothetical protein